ncbi:MAG: NAD(P)/FAD-dependent oxidoreductase [Actinobacteria bacterium]|nr:NAD(P)/FAD-dependent oxidoreductase [Actinomycetota bacterium]
MSPTDHETSTRAVAGPDAHEHFDVLIVGAGLSGIGAAHHVQTRCPWATYAIFEARDTIGGTWDLFRYPGIRSDSDMFTFSYSFRPWQGKKSIGDGHTILQYLKDTAADDGSDAHIRYHHRITRVEWSSEDARWTVTADRSDTGEVVVVTCSFLFSCTGYYRYDRGYVPDFEGMDDFAGQIVHPQFWPEDLDVSGKRVVVIGSGATAITLVPSLAATAGHVTMLQRSPTYVVSLPNRNPIADLLRTVLPPQVSGPILRWGLALGTMATYQLSRRRPGIVKSFLRRRLERQLPPGFDIDTHFTPRYEPWDQRLCVVSNGDMFKRISDGSASVVTDLIERFTPTGIRLASGDDLAADVIVPATGLDLLFMGGMDVLVDGDKVDPSDRLAYKGMMLEGVPNMALAVGYTNASWTLRSDLISDYVCRLLNHMRHNGLRQCTPTPSDGQTERVPLLGLTSGYVTRSQDRFPKQGSRNPWLVTQSYLHDHRLMKRSDVVDPEMVFTNPRRTPTQVVA